MAKLVSSTDTLYHYLFNPDPDAISAILENGLRSLSDFPESPRWKQIESVYPGFFEWLYNVPLEHIDPQWAVLSYVIEEQRHSYALSPETLIMTAELWDEEMVARWFGVDSNRLFFYVPQVVTYQPDGIQIMKGDFEDPAQP
jgi:hypothetical protein